MKESNPTSNSGKEASGRNGNAVGDNHTSDDDNGALDYANLRNTNAGDDGAATSHGEVDNGSDALDEENNVADRISINEEGDAVNCNDNKDDTNDDEKALYKQSEYILQLTANDRGFSASEEDRRQADASQRPLSSTVAGFIQQLVDLPIDNGTTTCDTTAEANDVSVTNVHEQQNMYSPHEAIAISGQEQHVFGDTSSGTNVDSRRPQEGSNQSEDQIVHPQVTSTITAANDLLSVTNLERQNMHSPPGAFAVPGQEQHVFAGTSSGSNVESRHLQDRSNHKSLLSFASRLHTPVC